MSRDLKHLFDAELRYRAGMETVVDVEGREGDLTGSGDGTVNGGSIEGKIRWSFFAACAYMLVKAGIDNPGKSLCKTSPGGIIETHDGAQIRFEAWEGEFDEKQGRAWCRAYVPARG